MTAPQLKEYNDVLAEANKDGGLKEFGLDPMSEMLFSLNAVSPFQMLKASTAPNDRTPYSRAMSASDGTPGALAAFSATGRMYLTPTITDADLLRLRAGQRIDDKLFGFDYKFELFGKERTGRITVTAKDIAQVNTFFGDRPLDNPGYSKIYLSGAVGANNPSNDRLDVMRVEQRLKYLGWSTFGRNMQGSPDRQVAGNKWLGTPKEFRVDGSFGAEEETVLRAFYGATHYTQYYGDGSTNSGNNGFQTTAASESAKRVTSTEQNDNNLAWLNAYNAPHWQNAYTALNIPHSGQNANFKDGTDVTEENYAVSWTVDLLKAWQISFTQQGLTNARLSINGLSDPTFRFGTHNRGGHSVGMSIDLVSNKLCLRIF